MPLSRTVIFSLGIMVLCNSCIEPFEPELDETQEVMVISGMISDDPGLYTITVSSSSSYRVPAFRPVEFCLVSVVNQDGDMIHYREAEKGVYSAQVPEGFLEVGGAASLRVVTPWNAEYRSQFDTLLACPGIDSVYHEIEYQDTPDPVYQLPGVRFYLDMSGLPSDSRNILWRINETWEYHASLFGTHRWWGTGPFEEYRSNPLYKCWKSEPLYETYLGTTRNLTSNELKRQALHFVSNETDRLSITYSILIEQQSLSAASYDYWSRMQEQGVDQGSFFEKQPASVVGNIYRTDVPAEMVLGTFYAAQVRKRRIFLHNNNYLPFRVPHIDCEYEPVSVIWEWENIEFPVYVYAPGSFQPSYTGPPYCFDCRLQGGDTIKPEYWQSWE